MTDHRPTVQDIIDATINTTGIDATYLLGHFQQAEVVEARHIATYLLRTETPLSYPQIAEATGRTNHTTAIHAHRKIVAMLDPAGDRFDPVLRDRVEAVAVAAQKLRLQRNETDSE